MPFRPIRASRAPAARCVGLANSATIDPVIARRVLLFLLLGLLWGGCSKENALLIAARSEADVDSIRVRLIDPTHLNTLNPSDALRDLPIHRTQQDIHDGEPIRIAIHFTTPRSVAVIVTGTTPGGGHLYALRCYTVDGVVRDQIVLAGPLDTSVDADQDGYPKDASSTCVDPDAQGNLTPCVHACPSAVGVDCNDSSTDPTAATINPGAPEVSCDGIDQDCNGTDACADADGDGWPACAPAAPLGTCDCNDMDPSIHPHRPGEPDPEICGDGKDQNCDGIDNPCDADGDGYTSDVDCNDSDPTIHPGAMEVCGDGVDNNCNGLTDEGCVGPDEDGDGSPDCSTVPAGTPCDCNDCDPGINPTAAELCGPDGTGDGIDEDCDGTIDEGCDPPTSHDADGDGYAAMSFGGPDCDDTNPLIHPGAPEHCGDGVDDNCNGIPDDGCDADTDGDGWAEPPACEGNAAVHPGATETCDGVDNNCNGTTDEVLATPTTNMSGMALPEGDHGCIQQSCMGSPACPVDFLTDTGNCGGCRISCVDKGDVCMDGACFCTPAGRSCAGTSGDTCCSSTGDSTLGGCEDLQNDLQNCGSCFHQCNADSSGGALPANVADTCQAGACACGMTSPCAGDTHDGHYSACCGSTCTDVETDIHNCGACGNECGDHQSCMAGVCTCDAPYTDCNGPAAGGCVDLATDLSNCGTCGSVCGRAHATAQCVGGTCSINTCDTGYNNCDGSDANGCETPLNTLTDCGSCGTSCSRSNASATCATRSCRINMCSSGHDNCDGNDANGCETPLDTLTDCGSCGTSCSRAHASATCTTRSCRIATCSSGYGNCDGNDANGCETNTNTTTSHCGSCGTSCSYPHAGASCAGGTCAMGSCAPGWADCDGLDSNGCETSLHTLADCGACGTMCSRSNATATCSSGTCSISSCNGGYGDCDASDGNGCETSLHTLTDCGSCGTTCSRSNATATCSSGTCSISSCNGGYDDCDGNDSNGCETSLHTLTDCGSCGTTCSRSNATATCSSGTCSISGCNGGYDDCDGNDSNGCETSLHTLTDCGSCGTTCSRSNATATCSSGTCSISSCNGGYDDCDGNDSNGCERNLMTDDNNCGMCGNKCTGGKHCMTGTCA